MVLLLGNVIRMTIYNVYTNKIKLYKLKYEPHFLSPCVYLSSNSHTYHPCLNFRSLQEPRPL